MGCNSYMYLKVTILDGGDAAREEAVRFAGESGWHVHEDAVGRVELRAEVENGWLPDVIGNLARDLSSLRLPATSWEALAEWYSYEDPHADGSAAKVRIAGGEISEYRESRTVYVDDDAPEWLGFELEPTEDDNAASVLPQPVMTYEQAIAEAAPREAEFHETLERFRRHPSNSYLEDQVTRLACRLNGYCDAIADMFGIGYDAVYEAAYGAYVDSVNCTAVSAK